MVMLHNVRILLTTMTIMVVTFTLESKAELFSPLGVEITETTGGSVDTVIPMRIFGDNLPVGSKCWFTRATGRLALGASAVTDVQSYKLGNVAKFSLIQPLEFEGVANIDSPNIRVASLNHLSMAASDALLQSLSEIVRQNFWDQRKFTATGGHLFTWTNQSRTTDITVTNTFQAALLSDGTVTFVIYNYDHVKMNTNLNAADSIIANFAKANSYDTMTLPYRNADVTKLESVSGLSQGTPGRFVYRIDSWPPVRGGCLTEDPAEPANRVLSSTVTRESVLGRSVAIVSGACHAGGGSGQKGTCTVSMDGQQVGQVPANDCPECGRAFLICRLPPALREGRGQLSMALTGSGNQYSHELALESPDEPIGGRITLTEPDEWRKLDPTKLSITYNPNELNGTVTLRVIGYSEDGLTELQTDGSIASLIKELHVQNISSEPAGQFDLAAVKCQQADDCRKYHVGYLEISDNGQPMKILRSNIIPLGWFVHKFYTDSGQSTWFADKCREWSDANDGVTNSVREQVNQLQCPCTLQLAQADSSRYLPATQCSQIGAQCSEALPKQMCFLSRVVASSSLQGAPASMCCYDSEKSHLLYQELIDSSNSKQHGSTSFRSHPEGVSGVERLLPGQVAHMSHWAWDTMRHMYCCDWSSTGTCPYYYMRRRPAPKCTGLKLGRTSSSVGDPHITSFGSTKFLFNGYGEYWLLQSDQFKVQGRFLAPRDGTTFSNFTLMSAVAFSIGSSAAYEVKFSDSRPQVQLRHGLGLPQSVTLRTGIVRKDNGVMLLLNSEQNLIVQLNNGNDSVGLNLLGSGSNANLHISLSDSMKDKTKGLYGMWTDNAANEFSPVVGAAVPFNANARNWDTEFCDKNRLQNSSVSLFNYDVARETGFHDINTKDRNKFHAAFDLPPISNPQESICEGNADCVFDLRVSNDANLARRTLRDSRTFAALQINSNTSVPYCDKPSQPGIRISATDTLMSGSSLRLQCMQPLVSNVGDVSVTCQQQPDGSYRWNPEPNIQCSFTGGPAASQANISLIIILVCCGLALIIVVVVAVVIILRRRENDPRGPGEKYMEEASMPMRPMSQPPISSQGSRDVIISSSGAGRGGPGGMENQGHRMQYPNGDGVGVEDGYAGGAVMQPLPADSSLQRHDPRYSYQESQHQPIELDGSDRNGYSSINRQQQRPPSFQSKSEVV